MAPFHRLLIANRGEIARRILRAAQAMDLQTVAVFSAPDRDAPVEAEADCSVHLPGAPPRDTYLNVDALVGAARASGADSVHPGYGFVSESAPFARACQAAGLVFVGPEPAVIEAMGSKVEAKRVMAAAGVPVLDGVTVTSDLADPKLAAAGDRVGYPLLVKAVYGGGGRGMRIVRSGADLGPAVGAAQREAAAAFGDGTVFLERFIESPHHVEVQIVGDTQGSVVHLFERECSIQRRHQKVIEEAPSPAVGPELRAALCAAAVSAGAAIGYTNAGTVEFVLDSEQQFWFLEVNTRLQVEHRVTELVTGLDLVQLQLQLAQGQALPPEARDARLHGHAIEARLYAEDVPAGFVPAGGPIHRLVIPSDDGVLVDAGYVDGATVSTDYDAMLAKVVAWAPTRADATRRLIGALTRAELDGPPTNRDLLVRALSSDDFDAGDTDTGFVERHGGGALGRSPLDDDEVQVHAVAATLAVRERDGAGSPLPRGIPLGWRNVGRADQPVELVGDRGTVRVVCSGARDRLGVSTDGVQLAGVRLWSVTSEHVDVEVAGVRRTVRVHLVADDAYVQSPRGASRWRVSARFPLPSVGAMAGSLRAPLPGRVVEVMVHPGDRIREGQPLVALEAMKMEHTIQAPYDGTVAELHVANDSQVQLGQVLLIVEPDRKGDADG